MVIEVKELGKERERKMQHKLTSMHRLQRWPDDVGPPKGQNRFLSRVLGVCLDRGELDKNYRAQRCETFPA